VLRRCSHECDPGAAAGQCDGGTTSTALWHARPGIQSFFPTLFGNASGMWPGETSPQQLPAPGTWYWRVRGYAAADDTATAWSTASHFHLNDDRAPRPPIRPLTPTNPLFTLEGWVVGQTDFARFRDAVPEDLRPFSAFVFDTRIATEAPNQWVNSIDLFPWGGKASYQLLGDYIKPALDAGLTVMLAAEAGPHWEIDWQSLAEIEHIFQSSANVVGVRMGELFWNWNWYKPAIQSQKQGYVRALITLCAKYGRFLMWGDGNALGWNWNQLLNDPLWQPFLNDHSSAVVLLPKTNILPHWYSAQSAIQGAWLSNLTTAMGVWTECWYWSEAGWGAIDTPPSLRHDGKCNNFPNAMWAQSFALGVAQGGTVFAVEGEGCTTANGNAGPGAVAPNPGEPAIWNHSGVVLPAWNDFVVPFMRAVINLRCVLRLCCSIRWAYTST
jgi:hypothetical protein